MVIEYQPSGALTNPILDASIPEMKRKKRPLPKEYPLWLVKCVWRSTAVKLHIRAKDELGAWDIASKQVKKMLGGMSCLDILVLGVMDEGH